MIGLNVASLLKKRPSASNQQNPPPSGENVTDDGVYGIATQSLVLSSILETIAAFVCFTVASIPFGRFQHKGTH